MISAISPTGATRINHARGKDMAIKGLTELLKKYRETAEMTENQFEDELNKLLPETWKPAQVYNELNEKYKLLETQKTETDKLLKEAKEAEGASKELKAKYDQLVATQKADKEKYDADLLANRKAYAIDLALTKAGAKNNKAVKALLDDAKITLNEKGEVVGLTEQLDSVRKDADYLFEAKSGGQDNPNTNNNPNKPSFGNGNQSGGSGGTADEALRRAFGL